MTFYYRGPLSARKPADVCLKVTNEAVFLKGGTVPIDSYKLDRDGLIRAINNVLNGSGMLQAVSDNTAHLQSHKSMHADFYIACMHLFTVIMASTNKEGVTLRDAIARGANGSPSIAGSRPIIVETSESIIPWEFVRTQSGFLGDDEERWLGDIAHIRFALDGDPIMFPAIGRDGSARKIVACFGDDELNYVLQERERFDTTYPHADLQVYVVRALESDESCRTIEQRKQRVAVLFDEMFEQLPSPHFLHISCVNDPSPHHAFRLFLRDRCSIADDQFSLLGDLRKEAFDGAFLNLCHSVLSASEGVSGFASWLLNNASLRGVVASTYALPDIWAGRMSEVFYKRFLPPPQGEATRMDRGLHEARKELLAEGSLIGFCYRVYGQGDMALA